LILFFYLSLNINSFAQIDTINNVEYSTDYKFKNGLYITFQQVLNNNPLPFERITNINKNDINWLENLLKRKNISFIDDNGIENNLSINNIWGYCNNNAVYIRYNNDFYRIPYIGKISHFVGTQTIRNNIGYDPYYGSYPGMYPAYETTNVVQNIIDFESGKIYPFSIETVQAFIVKDTELFNEFNALKKSRKKQSLFLYIRRFNERNPLYLPKNL